MNFSSFRTNARFDLTFFVLTALTWLSFFCMIDSRSSVEVELAFALGAGVISYIILRLLGYFESLRLLPRKSDVFLVIIAVLFSAIFQQILFSHWLGLDVCSLSVVMLWAPLLSLFVFGSHYYLSLLRLNRSSRRKIVLDLLESERDVLLADFEVMGMRRYLEFLNLAQLASYLDIGKASEIDLVIISRAATDNFDVDAVILRAHLSGIPIIDHRRASADLMGRIRLTETDLWSYIMEATPQTPLLRAFSWLKGFFEPIVAAFLLLFLTPLFLIIALGIKLSSRGPVLYSQVRTGYLGQPFRLVKFRTMELDAEPNGPVWCKPNDARMTRFGGFLRRSRLDELPQLWNVVRGEMGFFGPRPERPEIYEKLNAEIPLFSMRTIVRPGITGWAQVCAGYAATIEESKSKLEYDLYYIKHMSLRLDLIILIKTLLGGIFGFRDEEPRLRLVTGQTRNALKVGNG